MANHSAPWNKGIKQSKEELRAKQAAYYANNKDKILKKVKEYGVKNRLKKLDYMKWRAMYKKYGLTKKQWLYLYLRQNGECKICKKEKQLVVDHCHSSGKIRGLICDYCNILMGFVDNSKLLEAGLEYKRGAS